MIDRVSLGHYYVGKLTAALLVLVRQSICTSLKIKKPYYAYALNLANQTYLSFQESNSIVPGHSGGHLLLSRATWKVLLLGD